jgi:hypothetical protein
MVARPRGPCYNISDLVRDCSVPGRVIVRKTAREEAKQFGFETQTRIIEFVSNGVFDEIDRDNTDKLDFGPDTGILFDAYIFRIGPKYVYFAFYKRHTGIWVIKSFHPPEIGDKAPPLFYAPFKSLEGLKK